MIPSLYNDLNVVFNNKFPNYFEGNLSNLFEDYFHYGNSEIFSENFKNCFAGKFEDFVKEFWLFYLEEVFLAEYHSTLGYPILQQRIRENFYSDVRLQTTEDGTFINDFFTKIINDENSHTSGFKNLNNLHEIYTDNVKINKINKLNDDNFENQTGFQSISLFYIGECYFGTTFLKLYQTITDQEIKNFFLEVLKDETSHISFFRKISKKLFTQENFDLDFYINEIRKTRYFGLNFFNNKFNLSGQNFTLWENLVFNNPWQQDFNEKFLKKTYLLFENYYNHINFEDYKALINKV
jgi:hypothetical protein